jgi:hypothetical protein
MTALDQHLERSGERSTAAKLLASSRMNGFSIFFGANESVSRRQFNDDVRTA